MIYKVDMSKANVREILTKYSKYDNHGFGIFR
jgi:hypothetical protein